MTDRRASRDVQAGARIRTGRSGARPVQHRQFECARYHKIARIDAVDSHLILTHGQYDSARFLRSRHSTVDIYDRHEGVKLYEGVPLPERSRILGGGRYLYMLLDTDFPPWRVAKLQFRDRATRRP